MNPDHLRMLVEENDEKGREWQNGRNRNNGGLSILVVHQFLSIVISHRNEEG